MTKKELTHRLSKMNRSGTVMTVYSDGGETLQTMPDSLIPLRIEGDYFWLLWKSVGYLKGPQLCQTIKVVDYFVNAYLENKKNGQQWLTVTLQDDRSRLYLIEIIEPFSDPEVFQKWRKWQRYRIDNEEEFKKIDAKILKKHQQIADTWDESTE